MNAQEMIKYLKSNEVTEEQRKRIEKEYDDAIIRLKQQFALGARLVNLFNLKKEVIELLRSDGYKVKIDFVDSFTSTVYNPLFKK